MEARINKHVSSNIAAEGIAAILRGDKTIAQLTRDLGVGRGIVMQWRDGTVRRDILALALEINKAQRRNE